MSKTWKFLVIGLLTLAASGCGDPHPEPNLGGDELALDRSRFADLYIELRRAAIDADSTPDFAARKREILERYGVSAKDMLDFIERNGDNLQELTATWDSIYRRLSRADSTTNAAPEDQQD